MDNKPKITVLTGKALELALAYSKESVALVDKMESLQARYQAEAQAEQSAYLERVRNYWFGIADEVGIDAASSWQNPRYKLDSKYYEHGFVALIETPEPPSLANALGLGPQPDDDDQEIPPIDRSKLN